MLIDGEKYACEACVRGHRVSTCQHSDRTLTHINKKGRPVSQCQHCRGLRKARSTHAACECGVKPHKQEECNDNEGRSDSGDLISEPGSDPGVRDEKSCCCSHGLRCTCALKKEHLDPVPEANMSAVSPRRSVSAASKPRLLKLGSENSMTKFTNGHHKPVHKHNDSAHKCGLPYTIPIPHSVPGNDDMGRRSTDNLPMHKRKEDGPSQLHESIRSAQEEARLVRSEHGSPELRGRYRDGRLPQLDLTYPYDHIRASYSEDFSQSPGGFDNFYATQDELPMFSAGPKTGPVNWAGIDLNIPPYSAAFSQPPSAANYDYVARPPLTTSSSGELSELDDYQGSLLRPEAATSAEDVNYNRLSSSSYTSLQQPPSLSPGASNDLDYETLMRQTASPSDFEDSVPHGQTALMRHGFTVHDAQKLAHPETPTEAMGGLSLPPHSEPDHVWAHHFEDEENTFVPQGKTEDWTQ